MILTTEDSSCIFCDQKPGYDDDWENLEHRHGGPCIHFHDQQDVDLMLGANDSFDTICTHHVEGTEIQTSPAKIYNGFHVDVQSPCRREFGVYCCDNCKVKARWSRTVTRESASAGNKHCVQLLRNFWEHGNYVHVMTNKSLPKLSAL